MCLTVNNQIMRIRYKEVLKSHMNKFPNLSKNGPLYNIFNANFMGGIFILILGLAS